jgi:hypothetical protein
MFVHLKVLVLVLDGCVLLKCLRNHQNGEKKGAFNLMDKFENKLFKVAMVMLVVCFLVTILLNIYLIYYIILGKIAIDTIIWGIMASFMIFFMILLTRLEKCR